MNAKVRAILRVRPSLPSEASGSCLQISPASGDTVRVRNPRNGQETLSFNFDQCYGPDSSQLAIFAQDVAPLAEHALVGFNVTIFAYGNTGTGKTFTMEGVPQAPGTIGSFIVLISYPRDDSPHSAVRSGEPEEDSSVFSLHWAARETGRGEDFLPGNLQRESL